MGFRNELWDFEMNIKQTDGVNISRDWMEKDCFKKVSKIEI